MRVILLVALLLAQSHPPALNPIAPSCEAQTHIAGDVGGTGLKPTRVYMCQTAQPNEVATVTKAWFKAHCHVYSDNSVTCDSYATWTEIPLKDVAKPSVWKKRIETAAVTGAVVLIVAACVAGGGCAAMGGGN